MKHKKERKHAMEEMQVFQNERFGAVRTVIREGQPWFVAADVCRVLEIDRTQTRRLDEDEKGVYSIQTPGGKQEVTTVNEPGLYSLVLGSRKPEAKAFKRWITHEVIPAIRKTGAYGLTLPQDYPSALRALADSYERENALQEQNAALLPKANFADAVSNSVNLVPMAELSAYLYKNGVKIGRNKLMERLREEGFLYRDGYGHNLPTQKSKDLGLLDVKQGHYLNGSESIATTTTYVTGKGKEYFMRRFGAVKGTNIGRHSQQH